VAQEALRRHDDVSTQVKQLVNGLRCCDEVNPIESIIDLNPQVYFDVESEEVVIKSMYEVLDQYPTNPYPLAFLLGHIDSHAVPHDIQKILHAQKIDSDIRSGINFSQNPLCLEAEGNFLKSAEYNYFIILNESFFYKHYGRRAFMPLANVESNNSFFLKGVMYTPYAGVDQSIVNATTNHLSRALMTTGTWAPTRNVQLFVYKSQSYTPEDLYRVLESKKMSPYGFTSWGGADRYPPLVEY